MTAVLPHAGNQFRERVPAGVHVGNGFGKRIALSQGQEPGELGTPILLTNTLAAARAADPLIDYSAGLPWVTGMAMARATWTGAVSPVNAC